MYPVTLAQVSDNGEKFVHVIVGSWFWPVNPGVWKNTVPSSMKVPSGATWSRSLTAAMATKIRPLPSVRKSAAPSLRCLIASKLDPSVQSVNSYSSGSLPLLGSAVATPTTVAASAQRAGEGNPGQPKSHHVLLPVAFMNKEGPSPRLLPKSRSSVLGAGRALTPALGTFSAMSAGVRTRVRNK